jgi:hypothetical protein
MYHDIMDLYGDKGNILTLQKRALERGIEFEVQTVGIGQSADLSDFDLIFMGGGADKEQISLIPDLLSRKDNIVKAIEEKTFVLLICGGYQLFGQYYIAADGSQIDGLKIADYYTLTGDNKSRCIGNVIVDAELDGHKLRLVGFENHGGQTQNVSSPLGKVVHGCGNAFGAGFEGYYDGRILGTYLHGPLLPKNGELADFVLTKAIQKRNPEFQYEDLSPLQAPFEEQARKVLIDRYANIG